MTAAEAQAARALTDTFVDLYPSEAAAILEAAPIAEIAHFLEQQDTPRACRVLEHLASHLAADCLLQLGEEHRRRVLSGLDPAQAVDILGQLEEQEREALIAPLEPRLARELRELMSYPEDSAGHLMDTRVLTFRPQMSVNDALARIRAAGHTRVNNLLVVDEARVLEAVIPLPELVMAEPRRRLGELVRGRPPRVHAMAPREEVVELLTTGRVRLLPVVDAEDRLLGAIRYEALVKAVQEDAAGDLSTMVGGSREERALSSPLFAVRKRLPWLNINLLTAFLAAAVVGLFEDTIARFTALAVLLPVVAGQSGNTGAQALAVVMRGLALREIRVRHWAPVLLKEAGASALNGVAIALVTALGVFVWSHSLGLCFVIATAMVLSMVIAAVSGAAIPLLLTMVGQDPAQSASIILTTVTDVMGFLSFLGLATLFSGLL